MVEDVDMDALASAFKARLDEKPALEQYESALGAAIREIRGGSQAVPREEVDPIAVLNAEIQREAESIRPYLEKVDRRRKLEGLLYEINDQLSYRGSYDRSNAPMTNHRLAELTKDLKDEAWADEESRKTVEQINGLQVLIALFEDAKR